MEGILLKGGMIGKQRIWQGLVFSCQNTRPGAGLEIC